MVSLLQASSSVSASFLSAQSSQVSAQSSGSGENQNLSISQSRSTMLSASMESSVSVSNGNGEQFSLSTSAEFSLKFSQTTRMVIGQEGQTEDSPTGATSTDGFASLLSGTDSPDDEGNSLFQPESLTQRIYEDNVALFDDFVRNNGGELTKENVKDFVGLMKETIPEGFRQARSRLGDVGVMTDSDGENLTGARESVMDKLENFEETMIEKIENGEIESLEDLEVSDLPGVEGEPDNPFAGDASARSGFSLQLVQQTQVVIGRQGSLAGEASDGSNASRDQSASNQEDTVAPSFQPEELTDRIVQDSLAMLDEFLHARNQDATPESVRDFSGTIEDSVNEGFDQAIEKLEELDMLTSENSDTLESVRDRVMDRLDEVESTLVEGLEDREESSGESGDAEETSGEETTESSSAPASASSDVYSENGEVESEEDGKSREGRGRAMGQFRAADPAKANANSASVVA